MFLIKSGGPTRAFALRSFSKTFSSLMIVSMLAVSMPAAPRIMLDASERVRHLIPSFDTTRGGVQPIAPAFDTALPVFDRSPLFAIFTDSLAFAGRIKSIALPSIPAGLENAKLPTLGDRTLALLAPIFALVKPSTNAATGNPTAQPPPQPSSVVDFDFDNDGKADIGRWHSANTEFKVKNSNGGSYSTFTVGSSSAKLAPGDFNGDGKTDAAVFSAGTWTYKTSPSATAQTISFGTAGDIPVAGDYDGDATTDAAVYRPSTNTWWVLKSSGGYTSTALGSSGDIVVPGDYDGDGKNDVAVYRPSTGYWYINPSGGTPYTFAWGISIDTPVPADYDGDGMTDPAVFRPSTGTWYVHRSDGGPYYTQAWGNYGDQPVPGDYDGDNKADYAIWRPTTGAWYTLKSSNSSFSIDTLGVPGDTAVPSAYLRQVGGQVSGDALAAARLAPRNATGGTNLYSQNFSWGTSLVNLPGRAGLDAGFGISYNSLVWTKVGNAVVFDADRSNASPGFRFGFPTIEPIYYDDEKDLWAYMMITPSGGRAEFRQTVVTNTYETADSSYTQLVVNGATNPNDPVEDITIKVTTTDGTQMSYAWSMGAYRCTQIKDRNGNYISMAYDGEGRLSTMTDTLARVVTVTYETTTGYPSTITQTWKNGNGAGSNVTHTWATLTYKTETVATDFNATSIQTIVGPPTGTAISVLDKITFSDGSATKFDYNGYLQVKKVSSIAADSATHVLNSVETNLASPSTGQADCPRFTQTSTVTESFNGGSPVTVTNTLATGAQPVDIDGANVSASMIQVTLLNHPNGNITNTYVHDSGWKEGLPIRVDDYANGNGVELKRSSWTKWTQDNTNLSYILNPRVIATKVGDGTNTKKTAVEYRMIPSTTIAEYGLVSAINLLDGASTLLKRVETDYDLSSTYMSRRIIGLSSEVRTYESTNPTPVSKVTYEYDEGNFSQETNQIITASRHDSTNYGSTFIIGRGNLTSTTRHDVTAATAASVSKVRYDIAGSPVAKLDSLDRKIAISYADNFNTTVTTATFAYPTTVTDPAGNSSTVQYRFDIGANVEANSPAPAGNAYGKRTKRTFDDKGRLSKDAVWKYTGASWIEQAYTRYEYPENGIQSKVYSTIVDTNANNIADTADEVLTETWSDGAGRVRHRRVPHTFNTNGTTATWSGTFTEYDLVGRVKKQMVPTEVDASWTPVGDDQGLWRFTHQEYDWMGRVTRKINTDGDPTVSNDSDILISYNACGCAGGLETTIRGEQITDADWHGSTTVPRGRRTQKVYEDILGRKWKTEILNWDGTSVYSTTETTFNGRDQALTVTQTEASTTVSQLTTMTYDGHGRLKTRHIPQQDTGAVTTYNYNADDSVESVIDARAAKVRYHYNSRRLVETIDTVLPENSEIPVAPAVNFEFDNAGNRTKMTDGVGEVEYQYNSLSQMTAETRDFSEAFTPTDRDFRLEYTYTLGGQLKSYKDPYNQQIDYAQDKVGRLSAVTGSTFAGVTSYANNAHYRAWGALQSLSYGNNSVMSMTFDNRLRANHYQLVKNGTETVMSKNYSFFSDGGLLRVDDLVDNKFDRINTFDNLGRIKTAKSSFEARGETPTQEQIYDTPYRQSFAFNAFGNLTERDHKHWGLNDYDIDNAYTNNRLTTGTYNLFDADGRQTRVQEAGAIIGSTYNSAGQLSFYHRESPGGETEINRFYDGNGGEAKRTKRVYSEVQPDQWEWADAPTEYHIRSSVFGGEVVTDVSATGEKGRTYVRAAGAELAWQNGSGTSASVVFQNWDASGLSYKTQNASGTVFGAQDSEGAPAELDPFGGNVGTENPNFQQVPGESCAGCGVLGVEEPMYVNGQPLRFNLDGMNIPLSMGLAFFVGKEFALIQWQRSLSIPRFSHFSVGDDLVRAPANIEGAEVSIGQAIETGLPIVRHWITSEVSWSLTLVTLSYFRQQASYPAFKNGDFNAVKDALETARKYTKKKDCDEALKEDGVPSLAKLLAETKIEGVGANTFDGRVSSLVFQDGNDGRTKTIAQYFKENKTSVGAAVFDNLGPNKEPVMFIGAYFFSPPSIENLGIQRAFMIMHEAVHQFGRKSDKDFGGSKKLSQKLVEKCFPILKGRLGGVA